MGIATPPFPFRTTIIPFPAIFNLDFIVIFWGVGEQYSILIQPRLASSTPNLKIRLRDSIFKKLRTCLCSYVAPIVFHYLIEMLPQCDGILFLFEFHSSILFDGYMGAL